MLCHSEGKIGIDRDHGLDIVVCAERRGAGGGCDLLFMKLYLSGRLWALKQLDVVRRFGTTRLM